MNPFETPNRSSVLGRATGEESPKWSMLLGLGAGQRHIIDLSKWEEPKDWSAILSFPAVEMSGVHGVYFKVTDGGGTIPWEDPKFFYMWERARKQTRLQLGAYHYWREGASGEQQAILLYKTLGGDFGDLPIALDFELTTLKADPSDSVIEFLETIDDMTGRREAAIIPGSKDLRSIIYTGIPYWKTGWDKGLKNHADYFSGRRLWYAGYPYRKPSWKLPKGTIFDQWDINHYSYQIPALPIGWTLEQLLYWQFSDRGIIDGVFCGSHTGVDLNLEMRSLYNASEQ